VNFVVGEKFSSYEQLEEKITAYQDGNNIQLVYTDSWTLDAARKRASRKQMINYVTTFYTLHATSVESNFKAMDLVRELITGIVIADYLMFLNIQYH